MVVGEVFTGHLILIPLSKWYVYSFLQSNQALRQGDVLSREQLQLLMLGGQGELADPERKELIQKVNTLLKVNISYYWKLGQ